MKMVTQLAAATRDFIGEEHFKELTKSEIQDSLECRGPGATGAMEEGAQGSGAVDIWPGSHLAALEDYSKKMDDIKAARKEEFEKKLKKIEELKATRPDLAGILDKIIDGAGQVQEKSGAPLSTQDE